MTEDIRAHAQDAADHVVAWRWKVSPNQLNWQYSEAPPAKHPVYNLELLYSAAPLIPAVKKGPYWTCCYCDASLSCAACGHEQPDDSEHYAAIERERDQLRAQVEDASDIIDGLLALDLGSAERAAKFLAERDGGHPFVSTASPDSEAGHDA